MLDLVQKSIHLFVENHPTYCPRIESNDEVGCDSEEMGLEYERTQGGLYRGPLSSGREFTVMQQLIGSRKPKPNEIPIGFSYDIFYHDEPALKVTITRGWTDFEKTPENVKKVIFTIQNILSSALKIQNDSARFDTAYLKKLEMQAYQRFWENTCKDYEKLIPFAHLQKLMKEASPGTALDIPSNYYPVIPGIYQRYNIGEKLIWKSEDFKTPIVVQVHATNDFETTVITEYDQESQPILMKLSAATLLREVIFREEESK